MFLEIKNISKTYESMDFSVKTKALKNISLGIEKGSLCVIQGSSGSGKSTLLNCIGGLENIDKGSIKLCGTELSSLNKKELVLYRRNQVGFVFQNYNLIGNLTAEENIELCRLLSDNPLDTEEIIELLGISAFKNKFPGMLSGGQQQRCAIARAVIKNPSLLLCDEPTGALDSVMAKEILKLLEKVNRRYAATVLLVTHNKEINRMADRVIVMKDGSIIEDIRNQSPVQAEELTNL